MRGCRGKYLENHTDLKANSSDRHIPSFWGAIFPVKKQITQLP